MVRIGSGGRVLVGLGMALSFFICAQAGAAEQLAGRVLFVSGPAKIVGAAGGERTMARGDEIRVGDLLVTREDTLGQIKLGDGSLLALRPGSALKVESYGETRPQGISAVLSLARGAVRVINQGVVIGGTQAALVVKTPSASIRLVNADGDAFVIAAHPGGREDPDAGTYSRVLAGAGSIQTDRGNLWLERGAVGFAADGETPPSSLAGLPHKLLSAIASTGRVGAP